jgi:hypothetical protein
VGLRKHLSGELADRIAEIFDPKTELKPPPGNWRAFASRRFFSPRKQHLALFTTLFV